MATRVTLRWIVQLVIIFIVGFIVARNHLIIGSIGSDFSSPYENFYSNMTDADELYYKRSCADSYTLEDRKKVRWVVKKAWDTVYVKSYESFGPRGLAASFLSLHALFIVLCFVFIKLTIVNILKDSKLLAQVEDVLLLLFLLLTLLIFNGRVSEFSFSIIEGACIAAALYFSRVGKIIPFMFIVMFAVLNRESGFLILFLWFIFNLKIDRSLFYLLAPILLFSFVNYDILLCMSDPDFYIGSADHKINKNINNTGDIFSFVAATTFNHGIFFVSMSTIFYLSKHKCIFYKEIKYMYFMYVMYTAVFVIFTPVSHMSIKYIIIPLIVVTVVIYRSNHISYNE